MTHAILADPFSSAAAVFLVGFFLAVGDVIGRWYMRIWAKVVTAARFRLYVGRRLARKWRESPSPIKSVTVASQAHFDLGQILDDQVSREQEDPGSL